MIGDKNGCWYSYVEDGDVVHYEFFLDVSLMEKGTATRESMDGRFRQFQTNIDALRHPIRPEYEPGQPEQSERRPR